MSFRTHAASVTDTVFEMNGEAATFEPFLSGPPDSFGAAVDVTVLPTTTDRLIGAGETQLMVAEASFEVRVAEWAAPKERDRLTVYPSEADRIAGTNGTRYRLAMAPRLQDKRGLKWVLGCRREKSWS